MKKLPTNENAELMSKEVGAKGCIITLFFDDHNHVVSWFSPPIGTIKRSEAIQMLDEVLSLEQKER